MSIPSDSANVSVDIPVIKDKNDEILATRNINLALDALTHIGGGPAHINLRINQHWIKGDDNLEVYRKISRHLPLDTSWPVINQQRVLLVVGQHHSFFERETKVIEIFTEKYDVAIYVNHISNYNGMKSVHGNIRLTTGSFDDLEPELIITIGGNLGDYPLDGKLKNCNSEHWRVCEDGQYSDTYNSVTKIFECPEYYFFERMAENATGIAGDEYYKRWIKEIENVSMPKDFTLSHALIAQKMSKLIPANSNMHFAILNSLRFWELFTLDSSIKCYSNVAGFGIDGCLSTFLGQSVASDELNFLIIGDLSFFYDLNSIGIRHLKNNIRIILVNNHGGCEFRLKTHVANSFGDKSNLHIAAAGHFGNSAEGWVKNNDFEYFCVRKKEDLDNAMDILIKSSDKPILLEVFTTMEDDSNALQSIIAANDNTPKTQKIKQSVKNKIKKIIGKFN